MDGSDQTNFDVQTPIIIGMKYIKPAICNMNSYYRIIYQYANWVSFLCSYQKHC